MQKIIKLYENKDIDNLNKNELSNGWKVIIMKNDGNGNIIVLIEKDTRKEKLNHLNDLQDK